MAIAYMSRVSLGGLYSTFQWVMQPFEYSETKTSAGNGDSILVPGDIRGLAVTLNAFSGVGKVQTTTSPVVDVLSEIAVWVDWDYGEITSLISQDEAFPVTAIRQVNVSGTTVLFIRAQ